mmetsp:Transcript_68865/g.191776  ORF Transcript_68865/g.191776 Transcript_68865/m.191776 type:complete len:337 (+) Transcript_68865:1289-2299(+)
MRSGSLRILHVFDAGAGGAQGELLQARSRVGPQQEWRGSSCRWHNLPGASHLFDGIVIFGRRSPWASGCSKRPTFAFIVRGKVGAAVVLQRPAALNHGAPAVRTHMLACVASCLHGAFGSVAKGIATGRMIQSCLPIHLHALKAGHCGCWGGQWSLVLRVTNDLEESMGAVVKEILPVGPQVQGLLNRPRLRILCVALVRARVRRGRHSVCRIFHWCAGRACEKHLDNSPRAALQQRRFRLRVRFAGDLAHRHGALALHRPFDGLVPRGCWRFAFCGLGRVALRTCGRKALRALCVTCRAVGRLQRRLPSDHEAIEASQGGTDLLEFPRHWCATEP